MGDSLTNTTTDIDFWQQRWLRLAPLDENQPVPPRIPETPAAGEQASGAKAAAETFNRYAFTLGDARQGVGGGVQVGGWEAVKLANQQSILSSEVAHAGEERATFEGWAQEKINAAVSGARKDALALGVVLDRNSPTTSTTRGNPTDKFGYPLTKEQTRLDQEKQERNARTGDRYNTSLSASRAKEFDTRKTLLEQETALKVREREAQALQVMGDLKGAIEVANGKNLSRDLSITIGTANKELQISANKKEDVTNARALMATQYKGMQGELTSLSEQITAWKTQINDPKADTTTREKLGNQIVAAEVEQRQLARAAARSYQVHAEITDLIDRGKYDEAHDILTGQKSVAVKESFGGNLTDKVLGQEPLQTIAELNQESKEAVASLKKAASTASENAAATGKESRETGLIAAVFGHQAILIKQEKSENAYYERLTEIGSTLETERVKADKLLKEGDVLGARNALIAAKAETISAKDTAGRAMFQTYSTNNEKLKGVDADLATAEAVTRGAKTVAIYSGAAAFTIATAGTGAGFFYVAAKATAVGFATAEFIDVANATQRVGYGADVGTESKEVLKQAPGNLGDAVLAATGAGLYGGATGLVIKSGGGLVGANVIGGGISSASTRGLDLVARRAYFEATDTGDPELKAERLHKAGLSGEQMLAEVSKAGFLGAGQGFIATKFLPPVNAGPWTSGAMTATGIAANTLWGMAGGQSPGEAFIHGVIAQATAEKAAQAETASAQKKTPSPEAAQAQTAAAEPAPPKATPPTAQEAAQQAAAAKQTTAKKAAEVAEVKQTAADQAEAVKQNFEAKAAEARAAAESAKAAELPEARALEARALVKAEKALEKAREALQEAAQSKQFENEYDRGSIAAQLANQQFNEANAVFEKAMAQHEAALKVPGAKEGKAAVVRTDEAVRVADEATLPIPMAARKAKVATEQALQAQKVASEAKAKAQAAARDPLEAHVQDAARAKAEAEARLARAVEQEKEPFVEGHQIERIDRKFAEEQLRIAEANHTAALEAQQAQAAAPKTTPDEPKMSARETAKAAQLERQAAEAAEAAKQAPVVESDQGVGITKPATLTSKEKLRKALENQAEISNKLAETKPSKIEMDRQLAAADLAVRSAEAQVIKDDLTVARNNRKEAYAQQAESFNRQTTPEERVAIYDATVKREAEVATAKRRYEEAKGRLKEANGRYEEAKAAIPPQPASPTAAEPKTETPPVAPTPKLTEAQKAAQAEEVKTARTQLAKNAEAIAALEKETTLINTAIRGHQNTEAKLTAWGFPPKPPTIGSDGKPQPTPAEVQLEKLNTQLAPFKDRLEQAKKTQAENIAKYKTVLEADDLAKAQEEARQQQARREILVGEVGIKVSPDRGPSRRQERERDATGVLGELRQR